MSAMLNNSATDKRSPWSESLLIPVIIRPHVINIHIPNLLILAALSLDREISTDRMFSLTTLQVAGSTRMHASTVVLHALTGAGSFMGRRLYCNLQFRLMRLKKTIRLVDTHEVR